jgi:hypothetical protein
VKIQRNIRSQLIFVLLFQEITFSKNGSCHNRSRRTKLQNLVPLVSCVSKRTCFLSHQTLYVMTCVFFMAHNVRLGNSLSASEVTS